MELDPDQVDFLINKTRLFIPDQDSCDECGKFYGIVKTDEEVVVSEP